MTPRDSSASEALPAATASVVPNSAPLSAPAETGVWRRFDSWMDRASEFLSPILVKEARQALKSKQFVVTFSLLLLCGWAWSFLGVSMLGPGIHFSNESGITLYIGYQYILLFPLLIVVPFSAYRSLASEWEDGTYEMISITTLKAWQIVGGKLGSAVLQMAVYLSALLPFLAFTNMLRGIDVVTIAYLVFWTVMASLLNTIGGLCLATITRDKVWQIVLSVFLIVVTLTEYLIGCALIFAAFEENLLLFGDWEFWVATGVFVSIALAFQAMFFLVARARLLFPSQNRSTAIRVCMLCHQAIFAGWIGWAFLRGEPVPELAASFIAVLAAYWFFMGMFLTGENPQLSLRVKRSLPQSFFGRMVFTWFNPGSGTGYVFVVANLVGAAFLLLVGLAIMSVLWPEEMNHWNSDDYLTTMLTCGLAVCYLTIYLGISRLFLLLLRRWTDVGVLLSVLINVLLYIVGELVPLVVTLSILDLRNEPYSILQFPSPMYTIVVALVASRAQEGAMAALLLLLLPAVVVFWINFMLTGREIRQFRVAAPKRVQEEDAVLHPRAEEPAYRSPWDEDDSAAAPA